METPSFETTTQVFVGNHSMNIHIMSRLVSICQVLSEEEIQSKSSDNGCQVRAICHTTFIFFIQSGHTPRCPFFGGFSHPLKRVIQLCDTNQVHNSDEGCNGHVRYCCNLASVVLCKLSQLNLSETTGLNGTNLFWRTNCRIKKYINGLIIDSAIF